MDGSPPIATEKDRAAVTAARATLAPFLRRTPSIAVASGDLGLTGAPVTLKLEHLQHAATFKVRGAMAALLAEMATRGGRPPRCVSAVSKGNGGVAVAWAASRQGLRARIFASDGLARQKIARIRGFGAEIVLAGTNPVAIREARRRWTEATDAIAVDIGSRAALVGNATLAAEIAEDATLDTLLVPVGSGALIAGLALAAGNDGPRLVGVEPVRAATLHTALRDGAPVAIAPSGIAADTLGAARTSDAIFGIVRAAGITVVTTSDMALVDAGRTLWSALRLAVEPAAAAGLAALQSGAYKPRAGERVGILLTGANG